MDRRKSVTIFHLSDNKCLYDKYIKCLSCSQCNYIYDKVSIGKMQFEVIYIFVLQYITQNVFLKILGT